MHMIRKASYFNRLTFEIFTDASEVVVQFLFVRWCDHGCPMFGAEHDMDVVFY